MDLKVNVKKKTLLNYNFFNLNFSLSRKHGYEQKTTLFAPLFHSVTRTNYPTTSIFLAPKPLKIFHVFRFLLQNSLQQK